MTLARVGVLAPLLGLALVAGPASAHLGQEFYGRFPFVDAGGAIDGGATTWGLVLPADDGGDGYRRVCEEAVGPLVTFALAQPARGRVLLGTERGIVQTVDGGCRNDVVDNALSGAVVGAAVAQPSDPDVVFAVTANTEGDNGLWVSVDGGDTFLPRGAPWPGTLTVLAVDDDGDRIFVAGADADGDPLLAFSGDAGQTFVDLAAVVAARFSISALSPLPDGRVVVAGLDATAEGFVDVVDPIAVAVVPRGPLPRHVTHVAVVGDTLAALARNGPRSELFTASLSSTAPFARSRLLSR